MKVIHRGTKNPNPPWVSTCSACGSILEAERSEFDHVMPGDYKTAPFVWHPCPVCNKDTCFYEGEG